MDKTQPLQEPPPTEPPPSREEQAPTTAQSRKSWSDDDSDNEPLIKQARLTRKNLALFNKMGRKKASDPTEEAKSTRTTSTTSSGFAMQARENGILDTLSSRPPKDLDEIRQRHVAPRATASPPESVHRCYANRVERAKNEATMVIETSRLLKEYDNMGYNRVFDQSFSNLPNDVGFNNGLSAPHPDFVEGLEAEEYRPFPLNKHIPRVALYQDDPHSLALPHIAGEWKGRGKDMDKARLQSAYDGAAMVHARRQALAYMGKSDLPGHTEVTTFTTDGTTLNMYAHYAVPSEEDEDTLEYHQYQYASTNIKDSYQGHKDGRRGLRNAQDHAKTQSYALRDQLKDHWKQERGAFHPIAEEDPLPTSDDLGEASADEHPAPCNDEADEDDYEVVEPHPCQPTPAASAASRKATRSYASSERTHRKRKASHPPLASSRPRRSKAKPYWTLDDESGKYYHEHSNGTISWYDDDNDDED